MNKGRVERKMAEADVYKKDQLEAWNIKIDSFFKSVCESRPKEKQYAN